MKKILAGMLALAFVAPAEAGTYVTFGRTDCGTWVRDKTAQREAWLYGFLSGMNNVIVNGLKGPDQLAKLESPNQAAVWMDNYCRKNPLKVVAEGADELMGELINRKTK